MKLPTEIVTRHKIRDSKICSLWVRDGLSQEDIGERFKISTTRVRQILYKNKHLLKIDKEYEKLKRLAVLKRLLNKHPTEIGKKSTIDIVGAMRNELEDVSDKGLNVTVNVMNMVEKDGKPLRYNLGDVDSSRVTKDTG